MPTTPVVNDREAEYDFIIVGSGAGGGPLACNLARKKFRVLLIEAGSDTMWDPSKPAYQDIPAFHTRAAEDPAISWEYFVQHYTDEARSKRDSKWRDNDKKEKRGIFYPRASGLGGCTAHNAMITMSGPADDWDAIASLVDDRSWNSERMRKYFQRLENCHYIRPGRVSPNVLCVVYDLMAKWRGNRGRHGFDGWLDTAWADPWLIRKDCKLVFSLVAAIVAARKARMVSLLSLLCGALFGTLAAQLDPNHWERMRKRPEGLALVPMAVRDGRRRSVRDYLLETKRAFPNLTIWTDTLVTEVLFRDGTREAYGVKFMKGAALYKAHKQPSAENPVEGEVRAKHEIILAAGAFNTPQLLMLSGIGPAKELRELGIHVRVDLPGVGRNLQDRYEVSVIWEMPTDFSLLAGLKFDIDPSDREYQRWSETHDGLYATNGVLMAMMKKSRPDVLMPDLCIFALPGQFKGFEPCFSKKVTADTKHLTWLILKAHTKNRGGTVRLRSKDPREPPAINFSYFNEGSDVEQDDLKALVEGIKFVRQIYRPRNVQEVWPGDGYKSDAELAEWVANEAWGHHASCTCPMGPDGDPMAVLDESFRVRCTRKLRVVDASAFPLIPGVFIAANIYMLAERATDVIGNAYPR
jgi:choline dehydrogenase